jgi:cytochrome c-type biogenesis protein CcmH
MSLTDLVWLFIAASIAISALIAFPLRLDAARRALLSRLRSSSRWSGQEHRGISRTSMLAAAVFLLVAGIGAYASYFGGPPKATGSQSSSGENDDALARLKDYTRSIGTEKSASMTADAKLLPDVNTMIERLAARLKTAPGDIKGWQTLGWSYFHTARYKEAANAYAKAAALDPSSAELKLAYEQAKAKASETVSSSQTDAVGKGGDGLSIKKTTESEAMPPREHDAIRSMVDGLAARLESSPRDAEGWTRLMRSRVVLGERDVAATAFRKALEVFKDDAAATGRISAAAIELGLKAE